MIIIWYRRIHRSPGIIVPFVRIVGRNVWIGTFFACFLFYVIDSRHPAESIKISGPDSVLCRSLYVVQVQVQVQRYIVQHLFHKKIWDIIQRVTKNFLNISNVLLIVKKQKFKLLTIYQIKHENAYVTIATNKNSFNEIYI